MSILKGDIKLIASQTMDDVPEGGGGPTANVIEDGVSNAIFPDVSEMDRAGGRFQARKAFLSVQTDNRDTYMGSNIIVAEPPDDPNISVTLFATGDTFDRREDAVNRVESYLVRGPMWPGLLYENHVLGQRQIQLFQRPGTEMPAIGRTLVLVQDEGLPTEYQQYVRVIATESEVRTFTDERGDYTAMIVTCDISDALRDDYTGTEANRFFTRGGSACRVRDTTVADAGSYYGVVPLTESAEIGDSGVKVSSVYTQLVPSARTEVIALDQKPAAERTITLAEAPRQVTIGVSPHSMRIKVGQENRGYSWTQMMRPLPAPGTVVISFMALGQWYTIMDDGAGVLEGSGSGTVNYATGSIGVTLQALPDVGSSIIFQWGENTAYRDRSGSGAQVRRPEYLVQLDHESGIVPGSVVVTWESGEVLKTATDDGAGSLEGDALGEVNYNAGLVYIRPKYMIDAGGEFNIDYEHANTTTENFSSVTVDAGGFANLTLAAEPVAGTVKVRWVTSRMVSASSGGSSSGQSTGKSTTTQTGPAYPGFTTVSSVSHAVASSEGQLKPA